MVRMVPLGLNWAEPPGIDTAGLFLTSTVNWPPATPTRADAGMTTATLPARTTPPVAAETTAVMGAGAVPVIESGFTGGAVVTPIVVGADTLKFVGRSATPVLA